MNNRPRDHWAAKILTAIFLLFVGGLANQWLNIPAQQARQDTRLDAMDKHLENEDMRLGRLEEQHIVMMRQLEDLQKAHEKK